MERSCRVRASSTLRLQQCPLSLGNQHLKASVTASEQVQYSAPPFRALSGELHSLRTAQSSPPAAAASAKDFA
eukprot:6749-Heterococcus_DN1.PRE.1